MKKSLSGFISGVICTLLVCSLAITALAISGNVSFNLSPIAFNGEIISAAGEGYTLSNGCVAPASITYTDEKGGGTTYLPARRVSELMGVDIGWDPATGAVTVTGDTAKADSKPSPTPNTTANVPDAEPMVFDEEGNKATGYVLDVMAINANGRTIDSETPMTIRYPGCTYVNFEKCLSAFGIYETFSKLQHTRHGSTYFTCCGDHFVSAGDLNTLTPLSCTYDVETNTIMLTYGD